MKLYIAEYLAETTHLDGTGHGAYLLIIMAMWRANGKLPRDEGKLSRIARLTPDQWALVRDDVMEFFKVHGGVIRHKRISKEIAKYDDVVEASKRGGNASAAKRAKENKHMIPKGRCKSVQRKSNQPEPEPEKKIIALQANNLLPGPNGPRVEGAPAASPERKGEDLAARRAFAASARAAVGIISKGRRG